MLVVKRYNFTDFVKADETARYDTKGWIFKELPKEEKYWCGIFEQEKL